MIPIDESHIDGSGDRQRVDWQNVELRSRLVNTNVDAVGGRQGDECAVARKLTSGFHQFDCEK